MGKKTFTCGLSANTHSPRWAKKYSPVVYQLPVTYILLDGPETHLLVVIYILLDGPKKHLPVVYRLINILLDGQKNIYLWFIS